MQNKLISVILTTCLSGCVMACATNKGKLDEDNFVQVQKIGIDYKSVNGELIVREIEPELPADLAGLFVGDKIVSADHNDIHSDKELTQIVQNKRKGESLNITVMRSGHLLNFDIEPIIAKRRPTGIKLQALIEEGKKVVVAVVVSDVKNAAGSPDDARYAPWVDSIRSNTQSQVESHLLKALGSYDNFAIVDRNRLNNLLDEFRLSQTGIVSDKLRIKIGELTGATYLIDASVLRFRTRGKVSDSKYRRLIEIETGVVLAVDYEKTQ